MNRVLNFIKWPIAIVFFINIPYFLYLNYKIIKIITSNFKSYQYFIYGILIYLTIRIIFKKFNFKTSNNKWYSTLEHELIHAFFAIITFHKILGINTTIQSGQLKYSGKCNWLITIAPYFFPFTTMIVLGLTLLNKNNIFLTLLGFSLAYNISNIISQTKTYQTDLQKVTFKFAVMFLPGANLFTISIIIILIPHDKISIISSYYWYKEFIHFIV